MHLRKIPIRGEDKRHVNVRKKKKQAYNSIIAASRGILTKKGKEGLSSGEGKKRQMEKGLMVTSWNQKG